MRRVWIRLTLSGVVLILTLVQITIAVPEENVLVVGNREANDFLLESKQVKEGWKPLRSVKQTLKYCHKNRYIRITQIEALDLYGNGAQAVILKGGPGYNCVILQFESAWTRGINFLVNIYGK